MSEQVLLVGDGGDAVPAELFRPPAGGDEPRPAVVVVHEVFGLDAFTRSVAERFAAEGYVAIAPDMYGREGVPGPASTDDDPAPIWTTEQIRAAVLGLPDRRAVRDLEAAAELLAGESLVDADRIGVIGFCMGGNLAYLLGCHSRRIAAVVDFYGRLVYDDLSPNKPVQPLEMALNLTAPLLGFFGAEDTSIPLEHVRLFEERLTAFAKEAEIRVVPSAGHGFFNQLRPAWNDAEARATWERTLSFFDEALV
ncbi:MAG: dienelactone hydrolase family protein [bacterium]|nr:dienelactone hydrolase family protein [bacterium]